MACRHPSSVFGTLSASPRARLLSALDLGFGRSAALWRNDLDRVAYEHPQGHTFSLYLEGGIGTRRVDGRAVQGWPGALCVMPHGRRSDWEITAPFAFVHLYVPAEELGRAFAETFDRDARLLDLAEVTFGEAPGPAAALRDLAEATLAGDALAAEAAMAETLARVLADLRWGGTARAPLRGGIAPHIGRRVVDHVESALAGPIRLDDLARLANLSAAHFHRAFRSSFGVSPHAFVARRRAERAKALLRGPDPIAAIALACGFSSQSHFTHAFKAATGATPAAYRAGL